MSFNKCLTLIIATVSVAFTVNADVYMNWRTGGGFIWGTSVGATLAETPNSIMAEGSGNSILLQFIWTPNPTAVEASINNGPNMLGAGEVLLSSLIFTEAGTAATRFGSTPTELVTSPQPPGGYVYGRVFENDTPSLGSWYYQGEVVAANDQDMSATPLPTAPTYFVVRDPSEFGIGSTRIESIDQSTFSFQVIPEPGTIAMLALGFATLGGAAHKRRKAAVVEA